MARPLRIEYPGAFYHVFSRGNERKDIFRSQADYERFLFTLQEASERFDVLIHAFCLMPNHFHFLLQTKDSNLSHFMKRLLGVYTIRFNRRHQRQGHLFQGRYKAILIDKDSYFLELSRYIHLNPVKVKLKRLPEDYPYSSLKYFLKAKSPRFLHKDFTLKSFDSPRAYLSFVKEGIGQKEALPRPKGGCFLGSDSFIRRFTQYIHKYKAKDVSGIKYLLRTPLQKLQNLTKDKHPNFQIYCLWQYGRLTQRQIADIFEKTHGAVSQNIHRFQERLAKDKALNHELRKFESQLSELKD